jgi:hypothetical protein
MRLGAMSNPFDEIDLAEVELRVCAVLAEPESFRECLAGFLDEWRKREHAPRKVCAACQFESSIGFEESHAPGCERDTAASLQIASLPRYR